MDLPPLLIIVSAVGAGALLGLLVLLHFCWPKVILDQATADLIDKHFRPAMEPPCKRLRFRRRSYWFDPAWRYAVAGLGLALITLLWIMVGEQAPEKRATQTAAGDSSQRMKALPKELGDALCREGISSPGRYCAKFTITLPIR